LILAIAACNNWDIKSFNFVGAYLNGELDENEEIYMQSPLGYESDAKTIRRLQKSLYGLKQVGCKWYDTLVCALMSLGFQTTCTDLGVFYACVDKHVLILAVHVDDCIFTGSSNELIVLYKKKLNACYVLTDLGPLHWLLGIKVTRNRAAHTISLSQLLYIEYIISCFSLTNAKPCSSPMTPGTIYSKKDTPSNAEEATCMQCTPYHQA
jgi:Reverse transcriptase (RNA-dependent DNA polymerase)